MQSKPVKKHWVDLARKDGEWGREDCQEGWHHFAATLGLGDILDVGSGLGRVKDRIPNVTTQDPAPLAGIDVHDPVSKIPRKSYDAVTCFDVIEHVEEDLTFLARLCRISKKYVFLTTPNYDVSKAANGCHCREYTPSELFNTVKPLCKSLRLFVGDGRGDYPLTVSAEELMITEMPHLACLLELDRDSTVGAWCPWYDSLPVNEPTRPYGNTEAYRLGADWLKDCGHVEDWGCGLGGFRPYLSGWKYRGIDGTPSPFCDRLADLAHYHPLGGPVPGIFMRGVLEHDSRWERVLVNAMSSFLKRMCLVIHTPFGGETRQIKWWEELGVPDISFCVHDLTRVIQTDVHITCQWTDITSDTGYGTERIFYLEKR